MAWKKLNSAVSYYSKPSLGSPKSKTRYMALAVDKSTLKDKVKYGVAREVISRKVKVNISGFVDHSILILVKSKNLLEWKKVKELKIKGMEEMIKKVKRFFIEFIGLEDPNIYQKDNLTHVFFTMAYRDKKHRKFDVFLGHAQGKNLNSLEATKPVLSPRRWIKGRMPGFKEISIIPGTKIALVETGSGADGTRIARTKFKSLNKKFTSKKIVLDPQKLNLKWCSGELSTGPIIPSEVLKHKGYLVGFFNGRSKAKKIDGKKVYGKFKVGIMLVNPVDGSIPWVSPEPLIFGKKAKSITFASDLIKLNDKELILFAHTDDFFIRAYKIKANELKKMLPKL